MNKVNLVRQDDLKDCGICSLLMIIRYYHGNVPKEYLRELTKTSNDGVSAYYLVKAAQELGFSTKAVKGEITLLNKSDFPIIAHTIINKSYQHFVVLYGIKNNKIIIADPSFGIKKMSFDEWNYVSTKKYLIFKPLKKIPEISSNKEIIKVIYTFLYEHKTIFINIFLLSFIYAILNIIASYNFKLFMQGTIISNILNIKKIFIFLIVIGLIKNITDLFRNRLINNINNLMDRLLIKKIYSHIISLPYLYYKNRTCGDIITRINDITNIKDFIGQIFMALFVDLLLSVLAFIMLFRINNQLTLWAILVAILYAIVILIYNKIIYPWLQKSYDNASKVNSYLVETINAIDTIKGLAIEEKVISNLESKYNKYTGINKKIGYMIYYQTFFKELINYIGVTIIIYLGICLIKENKLLITDLITYVAILSYFLEPIKNIFDLSYNFKTTILSLKRVIELYNVSQEKKEVSHKLLENNLKGEIELKNVSFSYNGINNILNKVSFKINAGDKVLLIGESGSGKSTLVKIINQFYSDYQGIVYLDNRDLKEYDLLDIRNRICYVSQNEMLFTDTLYNNIDLYNKEKYDYFLKINQLTCVNEIVNRLPLGYDTLIEENGFNLSGGEKQRIFLARALLKEADIYIFDEALSAIDIKRERVIIKNMFDYLKDKTVIVVSHRFNNEDLFNKKINIEVINEC